MITSRATRTALSGAAVTAIAYGLAVLLLKTSVIIPAFNWVQSLTEAQFDVYLSTIARAAVATGALLLLATIVLTRTHPSNLRPGVPTDENNQ